MRQLLLGTIIISLWLSLFGAARAIAQDSVTCPNSLPPTLIIGQMGRVLPGDPNRIRAEPSTGGAEMGYIPGGAVFTVLDGPVCAEGYTWWQVDYNGSVGWTVQGDNATYWIEPLPSAGHQAGTACADGLPPRMRAGQAGRVLNTANLNVRAEPATTSEREGVISGGDVFMVIGGPVCAEGYTWWQVDYKNTLSGWAVEALGTQYLMLPTLPDSPALSPLSAATIGLLQPLDFVLTCPDERTQSIYGLTFAPDMRSIIYSCEHSLYRYDFKNPPVRLLDAGLDGPFLDLALIGEELLWGAQFTKLFLWDTTQDMQVVAELSQKTGNVFPAMLDARQQIIVTTGDNSLIVRDALTFEQVRTIEESASLVGLNPDGDLLLVDTSPLTFTAYHAPTGTILFELVHTADTPIHSNTPDPAAFSPDGDLMVTSTCVAYATESEFVCERIQVIIWRTENQAEHTQFTLLLTEDIGSVFIERIAFSPDGQLLGLVVTDHLVFFAVDGREVGRIDTPCYDFRFTPNGNMIICDTGVEARFWGVPQ
ncbi:MAG: SH3 domain-containing protein [Anaerolineaceae bacterium]|nr:SH3 domain-containing protein [Anaerolineaceae bacterium]